jgi:hypothetical protein
MSFKRLVVLLVVIGAFAAVVASLAAGSGGSGHKPTGPPPAGTRPSGVERSPSLDPKATEKYWTPDRMKGAKPVPIGIPGGPLHPPSSGDSGGSTAPSHP